MIEGFFPATAMPDNDWWAELWPEPDSVLRALGIRPGMTVVDLCCGDGYFTAPLARIVQGQVHAVDVDPAMIEQCRAALDVAGIGVLSLICADARQLPDLLPGKVDCVLIANTFHGVPDKSGMATAAAGVLRPGGRLIVINWYPLPRERTVVLGRPRGPRTEMRMSPEQVREVLEPAGFTQDRVVDLPPFHYGAIFRKGARKVEEKRQ